MLRDISFSVRPGSIAGLFGPNGSGKTTLFRCCLGLLKPAAGSVRVMGKDTLNLDIAKLARLIAYVPQAQQRDLQINLFCLLDLSLHYYGAEESELLRSLESFGLSEEQSERVYDYLRTAPAVYLKYYVGYLEMNALKKRAELQWSDNFSLLRFHRFVLEAGPSDFENLTKRLKQTAAKTGRYDN